MNWRWPAFEMEGADRVCVFCGGIGEPGFGNDRHFYDCWLLYASRMGALHLGIIGAALRMVTLAIESARWMELGRCKFGCGEGAVYCEDCCGSIHAHRC